MKVHNVWKFAVSYLTVHEGFHTQSTFNVLKHELPLKSGVNTIAVHSMVYKGGIVFQPLD